MTTSTALAVIHEIPTFRPPTGDRANQLERLTEVLYSRLAIAAPRPELMHDDVYRLGNAAQVDLAVASRASTQFLRAIFHAGFRPLTATARAWIALGGPLVTAVDALLPAVIEYGVPQMHLAALTASTQAQVLAFLQNSARDTARLVATDLLTGLDALADLMAVGTFDRVGATAGRVLHFRHEAAAQRVFDRGAVLPPGFSHWCFEGPGGVSARVFEVVNVHPYNPFRHYLRTPPRVSELLQAVPSLLRPAVTGLSGRLVRQGHGHIDPHTGGVRLADGVAYGDFHILLLGDDHVIASWEGNEHKHLINRLFGL